MKLTGRQKAAFGIGAVGKDMVYALSANYVMYYYQDIIGLSPTFVGLILMIARVFDAFNDPFMGILVAKTKTRWGRFRPYLVSGTVLNAFVLYALFAAPAVRPDQSNLGTVMAYFSVIYILWGMTYTMMDIPYWSMIPAITDTPADTENLSVIGRTCAGVGSALIAMLTVLSVKMLGGGSERIGFKWFALIVSVIFIVTEVVCAASVKERDTEMKTATIGEMFRALFSNDQAIVVVVAIVLVNSALYLTSNLIIYFFKYDIGGSNWQGAYTMFSTVGGAFQILGMMIGYPILRRKQTNTSIFKKTLGAAVFGYLLILAMCLTGLSSTVFLLYIPGAIVFASNGILTVLTTVFLSNSVDYGEIKTGHREESVIFSMQTFVVKLASGVSVFITGIGLDAIGLVGNTDAESTIAQQAESTLVGLRLLMTIMPMVVLTAALFFFRAKFKLTDDIVLENAKILKEKNRAAMGNPQ
ncbi:MAG: sugar:sodium symporter [Lachnospiraceae bacterium]|nr:sugar:sodium symporter [Lachnospiraceae bacterium]